MGKLKHLKRARRYLPSKDRVTMQQIASHDLMPVAHRDPSTPSAKELMHPPVDIGEGTLADKSTLISLRELPSDWLNRIEEKAKQGGSLVSFMNALNLTKAGFETLYSTSPAFAEAVDRALLYAEEWWENTGRDLSCGAIKGSGSVYIACMTNKYGWKTAREEGTQQITSEVNSKAQVELSAAELERELLKRGFDVSGVIKSF